MALCSKCQRVLPPNGRCLICGDAAYHRMDDGKSHAASPFKKLLARIVNLALVGGFLYGAYWLFLTEPGQAAIDKAARALKLKSPRQPASPAQEILGRYPKLLDLIQDPGTRIEEIQEDARHAMVILISHRSITAERFSYMVNVETGLVTPQNDASAALLKP